MFIAFYIIPKNSWSSSAKVEFFSTQFDPIIFWYEPMREVSEKAMTPHSSTLAWKVSWTEEPGRLQSWCCQESHTAERFHFHFPLSCIGEGNGNPLQCSWLENPRDGGAWWPAIYGVTQSRTQLKRLSSSSREKFWSEVLEAQSCLTLCDPMDYSPPGSSVPGILLARILEWVAIPFSRGSSQRRDQTHVSHIAGRFFTVWANCEDYDRSCTHAHTHTHTHTHTIAVVVTPEGDIITNLW